MADYEDHSAIVACACVADRLRDAVSMFDRARDLSAEAVASEDPHAGLGKAAKAAQLRVDAADVIRGALRAIQDPAHHEVVSVR